MTSLPTKTSRQPRAITDLKESAQPEITGRQLVTHLILLVMSLCAFIGIFLKHNIGATLIKVALGTHIYTWRKNFMLTVGHFFQFVGDEMIYLSARITERWINFWAANDFNIDYYGKLYKQLKIPMTIRSTPPNLMANTVPVKRQGSDPLIPEEVLPSPPRANDLSTNQSARGSPSDIDVSKRKSSESNISDKTFDTDP